MDSKKVLQKLLKIAENQQKMIMKLAQDKGALPPDSLPNSQVSVTDNSKPAPPTDTPPAGSKPSEYTKTPNKSLYDNLPPTVKPAVRHVNPPSGNEMQVIFYPGKLNQKNWDAVLAAYQGLLDGNVKGHKIFTNYKLTYAQG